ncbi:MAG: four helix bundle protein [Parcubacteria group bacterium]
MTNNQKPNNKFDLEKRTTEFAKRVIRLCRALSRDSINNRLSGQGVGSAGSMGANYREANDALGKKDFLLRMRIARKEAKETMHWLECIEEANPEFKNRMQELKKECVEIKNIFSAIIIKVEKNNKKKKV